MITLYRQAENNQEKAYLLWKKYLLVSTQQYAKTFKEISRSARTEEAVSEVQDLFINCVLNQKSKASTDAEFLAWARTVIRHKLIDIERKCRRRIEIEHIDVLRRDTELGEIPLHDALNVESKEKIAGELLLEREREEARAEIVILIREMIAELPKEKGEALSLVYFEGRTLSEGARMTRSPVSKFRYKVSAAIKELLSEFERKLKTDSRLRNLLEVAFDQKILERILPKHNQR